MAFVNNQLLQYVQRALETGMQSAQVRNLLIEKGWDAYEVNQAIDQAEDGLKRKLAIPFEPPLPPKKSEWDIDIKDLSASHVLLYLGGLVVLLAGIIYLSLNWYEWSALPRILAITVPMLVCFVSGASLWPQESHKKQGAFLLSIGSFLFPLFLGVTFKELLLFEETFNPSFNFTASLITFCVYLGLYYVYRFPVWNFLAHAVAILVYYNFWRFIGVEQGSFPENSVMPWLLAIFGTSYVILTFVYEKVKSVSANYVYPLGMVVLMYSFLRLGVDSIEDTLIAGILLAFGVAYFIFGMWIEKREEKRYSTGPYILGVGLITFAFIRFGIEGLLLKNLIPGDTSDHIGWSMVIVGLLYMGISRLLMQLKRYGLEEGYKFYELFDIGGSFVVLAALFVTGLGGPKPLAETLLLVTSVGYIFVSVASHAKHYLFTGTVFLIVYIFAIGGEYFQDEIGWPLTLFVAGLSSMAVSVVMEKVRRKYFLKETVTTV